MGWISRLFGKKDAGDFNPRRAINELMTAIMGTPPPPEMLDDLAQRFDASRRMPGLEDNPLEATPELVRLFVLYEIVSTVGRQVLTMAGRSFDDVELGRLVEEVVTGLPETPTKREIVAAIKTRL